MKNNVFVIFFVTSFLAITAQTKTPLMFRLQDKHAKKHIKKYVHHDTLITTSNATLHFSYNIDNSKPYLLMLHGIGVNARTNWYNQIEPLSKDFNLILPDLIYFGESTSSSQNMSIEFQVQQIHEAIIKLRITEKLNVMGFSYGGLTAAMYNELYQTEINKLIIIDGPVKFYSEKIADSLACKVGVKSMGNVIVPQTPEEFDAMQKAVMSSSFHVSKRLKRKIIKYYFSPTKTIRHKQLDYLTDHQNTYQTLNYNLDKTPTLLIWGGLDGVVPPSVGINLNKTFPTTTKLIIYPTAKHDAHFSQTKALNEAVVDFIKD